jgi:hypothetical protein
MVKICFVDGGFVLFHMDNFTSWLEEFALWRKMHIDMDEMSQKYGHFNINPFVSSIKCFFK